MEIKLFIASTHTHTVNQNPPSPRNIHIHIPFIKRKEILWVFAIINFCGHELREAHLIFRFMNEKNGVVRHCTARRRNELAKNGAQSYYLQLITSPAAINSDTNYRLLFWFGISFSYWFYFFRLCLVYTQWNSIRKKNAAIAKQTK